MTRLLLAELLAMALLLSGCLKEAEKAPRISLGALIIALGLLVDDAMITVEMMVARIEEGVEKSKAAVYAYTQEPSA